MKVHGTEIPAVVKQNNKGQTATEPPAKKGQQQQKSQQQLQHHSRERGASHDGAGEEHFKSPDSVKSELTEEGVAGAEQVYPGSQQQPGYIMGVPGESKKWGLLCVN